MGWDRRGILAHMIHNALTYYVKGTNVSKRGLTRGCLSLWLHKTYKVGHGLKKIACVALSGKFLMQYDMTFWKVHNL